jgi:hypothetical protein
MAQTSPDDRASDIVTTIGPFALERTPTTLRLRQENRGEFTLKMALFYIFAMGVLLILAVASVIVGTHQATGDALLPQRNLLGFLWAFGIGAMLVGTPPYLYWVYRSAASFVFDRETHGVFCGKRRVTAFRQVEYIRLHEGRDPDSRYLYDVTVVYGDGRLLEIHNGYDERVAMNLANEISRFIGVSVRWR